MIDPLSLLAIGAAEAAGVAAVGGLVALGARYQRRVRQAWEDAARAHGLDFDRGGFLRGMSMKGVSRGVSVEVRTVTRNYGNHSPTFTLVEARVPVALPAGLHLRRTGPADKLAAALGAQDIPVSDPLLDEHLRVRGHDPVDVRALLDHPHGASGAGALLRGNRRSHLEDDTLVVELGGHADKELDAVIGAAVDAANALVVAAQAPWADLARHHGLRHTELGLAAVLEGAIDGVPVRVQASGALKDAATTLRVDLGPAMPRHVTLTAGDRGPRIGDPILDGRIQIEGPETELALAGIQARLDDPDGDLRGCLMDVLHGIPGARIEGGSLVVTLQGRAGHRLDDLLARGVALGRALQGPTRPDDRWRPAVARQQRS